MGELKITIVNTRLAFRSIENQISQAILIMYFLPRQATDNLICSINNYHNTDGRIDNIIQHSPEKQHR